MPASSHQSIDSIIPEPLHQYLHMLPHDLNLSFGLNELLNAVLARQSQYSLLSSAYDWDPSDRDAIAQKLLQFEGSNDPDRLQELRERVGQSLRKEVVEAELRTFASVRKELGLTRIDLLKIDVEKAEWDVVCGISDADWAMTRQVAIETHVIGDRVQQIKQLLQDKGFTRVHVGEIGTPKFLGFKYYNKLHPDEGVVPPAVLPSAEGAGLVCNIYATRD
ncbi:hypothetical protein Vafri_15604 [Volvox africanus]|uniref:Methyltransferase FkbM domain-containing protein n=1 Tax=Volvox africanus TaxID=51714 RepID=A0A8J4F857_9CHLO|nr:hypothetical protein Vafri_15604 [Volvox africanus]